MKHDLAQRGLTQIALWTQFLNQLGEGQVLMFVGFNGGLSHSTHKFSKGEIAGNIGAKDQCVDEKSDQILAFGRVRGRPCRSQARYRPGRYTAPSVPGKRPIDTAYSLARVLALAGKKDEAMSLLTDTLHRGLGSDSIQELKTSSDWNSLRKNPQFQDLVATATSRDAPAKTYCRVFQSGPTDVHSLSSSHENNGSRRWLSRYLVLGTPVETILG